MKEFQINTSIALSEGIQEIIEGRILSILEGIHDPEDPHTAMHETRRTLKRIRAILRLIRDEIGYSHYYRENAFYRHTASLMAPSRDTYVLLKGVEIKEKEHPAVLSGAEFILLRERLSDRIKNDLALFTSTHGGFQRISVELERAKDRLAGYCRLRDDFTSIRKGLGRVYGNGRRRLFRITEQFSMEVFHEYRKNTKYLQYQMELLKPVYPKLMKAYASTIDRHAELLGEVRDLDRLELFMEKLPRADLSANGKRKFLEVIREERKLLMDRVFLQAGLVYAEKKKEFVNRINAYWAHHLRTI